MSDDRTITLREFGEAIDFMIQNNIKHSILGLGAPGIGKSQIIKTLFESKGYRVQDVRLAQMSEVEIGGLIFPSDDKKSTVWLRPGFLPTGKEKNEKGQLVPTILLLDEITSCSKRVQVAAYQLVLDRKIGDHKLPDSTVIVALGNREDDNGVFVELAAPLADRFTIMNIRYDSEIWLQDFAYDDKNKINPFVTSYITAQPEALHTQTGDNDSMIFSTPRSWVKVSDLLNKCDLTSDKEIPQCVVNLIYGILDEHTAAEFLASCKNRKALEIVEAIMSNKPYNVPQDNSDIMFIGSCLRQTVVSKILNTNEDFESFSKTFDPIFDYLTKISPEHVSWMLDAIMKVDEDVRTNGKIGTTNFRKYINSNKDFQKFFTKNLGVSIESLELDNVDSEMFNEDTLDPVDYEDSGLDSVLDSGIGGMDLFGEVQNSDDNDSANSFDDDSFADDSSDSDVDFVSDFDFDDDDETIEPPAQPTAQNKDESDEVNDNEVNDNEFIF